MNFQQTSCHLNDIFIKTFYHDRHSHRLSSPKGSKVEMKLLSNKNSILVKVKDKGKGIAKNDQDQIFVPFTPISTKGTEGEKGTGLGMSIVKQLVLSHNGEIRVESELGKGTIFFVRLPC